MVNPIKTKELNMSPITRALSMLFTSLPSLVWLTLNYLADRGDYFWITYQIVGFFFLAVSLFIGDLIPRLFPQAWIRRPGLWIAGQGALAWGFALVALALLNLTPLCIGQDNGDGFNDLGLCMLQTGLVAFLYSFPQAVMLALSAIPGGLIVKRTIAPQ
jgi:hypothetical protein